MKPYLRPSLVALLAAGCLPAWAGTEATGFDGATAASNFTTTNTGSYTDPAPVLGSATFTTTQLTLVGSNAVSPDPINDEPACVGSTYSVLGPCSTRSVIALAGVVSFDWSYLSSDSDGAPGDFFGVLVDNVSVVLSDLGGANSQTGTYTFTALQSFGWFMNCTDCINGSAQAVVTNLNVDALAVPEPATLSLAGLGVLVVAAAWRRAQLAG